MAISDVVMITVLVICLWAIVTCISCNTGTFPTRVLDPVLFGWNRVRKIFAVSRSYRYLLCLFKVVGINKEKIFKNRGECIFRGIFLFFQGKNHSNIRRNLIDVKEILMFEWFLGSASRIRIRFLKFWFAGSGSGRNWTGSATLGPTT